MSKKITSKYCYFFDKINFFKVKVSRKLEVNGFSIRKLLENFENLISVLRCNEVGLEITIKSNSRFFNSLILKFFIFEVSFVSF